MVFILRDHETLNDDVVLVTETTTAKEIENIIEDTKDQMGDNNDDLWEEIESRLPKDVKVYTEWKCEFEMIYW